MNNVKYQSVFETRFTTTLLYKGILNISNKSIFKFKFFFERIAKEINIQKRRESCLHRGTITKNYLDCVMSVE